MNLYELDNAIREVIENGFAVNENTGEVFEDTELEKLNISLEEKINNIIGFIKNLDIEEKVLSDISKEYKERAEKKAKKAESLKNYLSSFMQSKEIPEKETRNGKVFFRKSTSTVIENEEDLKKFLSENEDLKEKYVNVTTTEKYILKNLKEDIDDGKEIPGVIVKTNINLQVK